jgi:hypothetical protein
MEITARGLWTLMHGMGFGALYLLACSGALIELRRWSAPNAGTEAAAREAAFLKWYLMAMATLAWMTVLTGTYVIYPWYRAAAPAGLANLSSFPQALLKAKASTAGWHSLGMEWKEHVAWLTPISITMAAAVAARYGRSLRDHPQLRAAVLVFTAVSFLTAGVAGFFGAMLNKHAPVEGGSTIQVISGEPR